MMLVAFPAVGVFAQDTPQPPPAAADERTTGLPPGIDWDFNFDAGWGSFGFANSLFQNPKEDVEENLSDQWSEGFVKPALSGTYTLDDSSQFYGKLSAVGERTYGSAPELVGTDFSSFKPEDLSIGYRSGTALTLGENVVDVTIGRAQYTLGRGMLLWDGGAEGGSRGGFWSNARKAFEFASIARFQPAPHKAHVFYLDKDELPESDKGTRLWGANYEYSLGDHSTFGASYMRLFATPDIAPERDGLDVFNVRAYTAWRDLSFDFEFASESNADLLRADAWVFQGAYALSGIAWTPTITYRYALFEGDDLETERSENFDPLLPGFSDWGAWWQGEIAGEYFLSNSNLESHLFRAHVTPTDAIGGGILFFQFNADRPESFAPGVTEKNVAFEIDGYVDWKINRNFTASFVGAFANPQAAAEQAFNRTQNFTYGMVFVAYSY